MRRRKKKRKVLLNYDPSRYDAPVRRIQHVTFVSSDGKDQFTLSIPADELEGKSEEEKNKVILDRFNIFMFVRTLDIGKDPKDERLLADMVSRFTWLTARAITLNVIAIYIERARTEEVIDRRKEPDSETLFQIGQNLTERIYTQQNKTIIENRDAVNKLDQQLFSNIFANAILHIHRQQGSVFDRPGEDVKEAIISFIKKGGLAPYEYTTEAMAEVYAAQLLDRLCPVKMSIEELRSFILAKVDSVIHITLPELNRLLTNLQRKQKKDIICRINNDEGLIKISLKPDQPIDPKKLLDGPPRERSYTKEHFRELSVAAVKEMAKENKSRMLTKKYLCEKLGISDTTLNNYMKDDPALWPLLKKSYTETLLKKFRGD